MIKSLIGLGILLIITIENFILLGGINQKAFIETMMDIAKNIGNTFTSWVDKVDVDVTDSGIYVKPADSNGGIITGNSNQEYITLGDIGKVCMCKRIMKNETSESGDVPFYKIGTFGKQADAYISYDIFNM